MSREEEETSYVNESQMDLLSTSEKECAMVAQASRSSEDLDDSIVTFGQQNSEKENFEKLHYESLFKQENSSEEEMSTINQEELQMKPHMLQNSLEKILFAENRACGTKKKKK